MANVVAENRRSIRVPAAYPVAVYDRRGKAMAKGRTANISESGVVAIVSLRQPLAIDTRVILELSVPSANATRRREARIVAYLCRVVRRQSIGHLTALGVEFVEKLS
jgi:hypothetical protein